MAWKKQGVSEPTEAATRGSPSKRKREGGEAHEVPGSSPAKRKRGRPRKSDPYDFPEDGGEVSVPGEDEPEEAQTPSRRKRKSQVNGTSNGGSVSTPRARRSKDKAVETPSRSNGETPRWRRNDRSARKKSARALIERVVGGDASDEEDDENLARQIYESSEEDEDENLGADEEDEEEAEPVDVEEDSTVATTPSKRPRGRPRGSTTKTKARKKSPTPPRDLPPHELYFAQNRPGAAKTSNNNLANLQLLTHEEYFTILHNYKDPHAEDTEFLQSWHAESFPQWAFELSQGFSVCLYGYGSKRPLLHRFAKHLFNKADDHSSHKIVVVNGYVRNSSLREILGTIGSAVEKGYKPPAGNPSAMLDDLKAVLSSRNIQVTIMLNSIDAPPLRKSSLQAILAQLSAHPRIQLICSADTPDFPLLWDSSLRSAFNFIFHDCTTFVPFTAEIDVVDEVHELLGRQARRVGGKEGVTYVLRSLPENAKNLFRLLVGEVLAVTDDESVAMGESPGVEYRMVYNKAVEEFICSSEMAFRTLLKEFHDHQMITSRKDVLGTELLSLPFRKEELEAILEDLVS